MELADVFAKIVNQNIRIGLHYAVVTAIENDGGIYYLTIELAGSTTPITKVRYLRGYVPRIGDTVVVQVNKSDIFVVDSLAEAGRSLNPVAYRTTLYTVPQNVDTTIPFQAVINDTWDMWDVGSASVLTCKIPGRYAATASVLAEGISNVGVSLSIFKGTQEIARLDEDVKVASHSHHMNVSSMPFTLAVNDTVSMKFLHDNNPNMDLEITSGGVDHTGFFNALSVTYLGP